MPYLLMVGTLLWSPTEAWAAMNVGSVPELPASGPALFLAVMTAVVLVIRGRRRRRRRRRERIDG